MILFIFVCNKLLYWINYKKGLYKIQVDILPNSCLEFKVWWTKINTNNKYPTNVYYLLDRLIDKLTKKHVIRQWDHFAQPYTGTNGRSWKYFQRLNEHFYNSILNSIKLKEIKKQFHFLFSLSKFLLHTHASNII